MTQLLPIWQSGVQWGDAVSSWSQACCLGPGAGAAVLQARGVGRGKGPHLSPWGAGEGLV